MTSPPTLRSAADLAASLDLPADAVSPYGRHLAKVDHRLATDMPKRPARYVLVTAVNPTPAGEGKTVHTIGLAMSLEAAGKRAVATLRQPSMGPVFGVKGGGAGGGKCRLEPADRINLHLTGDFHAVGAAHNLLAAAIDTSLLLKNPLQLDPERIAWRRVVDMNDRALREVRVGLGGPKNGIPRDAGFEITSASELMAILALSADLGDMRARLGRITFGESLAGKAVTAEQLCVAGAMAAVMRDALDPTLVQTCEGTPVLVHAGPFANIAHGNCSVVADRIAAGVAEYVVTEAGFGSDMGAEKFFNIKCRATGMAPDAGVVVATVRALKAHSGEYDLKPGRGLPPELSEENLPQLEKGCANLEAHVANLKFHGVPCVVAVNRHPSDTDAEVALVKERALAAGARAAVESRVFAEGSRGGRELAAAVIEAAESGEAAFRPTYELDRPLPEKLLTLATDVYGAATVCYEPRAQEALARLTAQGAADLPVCVAKTQYSLSHDKALVGRPTGFELPITDLRLQSGAGFVVAYAGDVMTMPGLGSTPNYRGIELEPDGTITGLF